MVYYYFARWQTPGLLQRLNEAANRADRLACNRLPTPSLALVNAQSVKLAQRWVVECTFAWLNYYRRLAVDYERTTHSHAAWLLIANLAMTLQRAKPC